MPETTYTLSKIGVGTVDFLVKDDSLTTLVAQIIEAIGANNDNVADRINNLHSRSFDAEIKIYSQNESEIANIIDGLYKVQYITITGEGTETTETLNNSAILIQKGTNQYLIKDGQILSRTKTNDTWGTWTSNNVKPDWEAVAGSDAEILNKPDLSHFIISETQPDWNVTATTSAAFIKNKPNIVIENGGNNNSSIIFSPANLNINAGSGYDLNLSGNSVDINGLIFYNGDVVNANGESVLLKVLNAWSPEYDTTSDIDDITLSNDVYKVNFYELEIDSISNEIIGEHLSKGLLIHNDNTQYLIKDNEIKYRVYENNTWSEWQNTNVKPDWNATSGSAAEILNKPTIATTVTQNDTNPVSGSAVYGKFADLIGAAPAALDTLQEIASALNNDADLSGTLTTQISTKVPKVSSPTPNNFASFNSDGTIKDSGVSASSFITSIKTVNNESLVGTGNIVVSGLPQVSASDNGKILMVVNGQWQLVSPSVLYTGQGVPNNAQGNNGDLYIQTD